jgi:hypothetical protein
MEENQYVKAVSKLNTLTREGKLIWKRGNLPIEYKNNEQEKYGVAYICEYENKRLRIYTKDIKVELFPNIFNQTYRWENVIVLEIIDLQGATLWSFPNVPGLNDLNNSIKFQVSGAKDLLDSLTGK